MVAVLLLRPGGPAGQWLGAWQEGRRDARMLAQYWPTLIESGDRVVPGPQSPRLVEFMDYQCPVCRAQHAILSRAGIDTVLVLHHFPLPYHPHSMNAAKAVICAGRQSRLAEMHNRLLDHSKWQTDGDWDRERRASGVQDSASFHTCMADSLVQQQIDSDVALGEKLQLVGTPTFFTKSERFSRLLTEPEVRRIVREPSSTD